ncbi:MAG: penicillin acylase family protein [Dehalococcoidia bacterium]
MAEATPTTFDPREHLPRYDGSIGVAGLGGAVRIHRDAHGIPHVEAPDEASAWFGMGYACAQDRLWQLEWYRRRGRGRWSEVVGASGLPGDRMFRRLRLVEACAADVAAMSPETRAMFEQYADGVNALAAAGEPLPPEFALAGIGWEPWTPEDCVMVFKVRHAIMGKRLLKLARLEFLRLAGPDAYALLEGIEPGGINVILPPGGAPERSYAPTAEEVRAAAADLGTLASDEGGSNSWAVHGSHTTTGRPVICNDSHRPLDVPNVYWQAHLWCPEFNVAGGAFPGVPAFPHFGFSGGLAWNITHGQADYQDLFFEEFRGAGDALQVRTEHGWTDAEVRTETIEVRGAPAESVTLVRTRNGEVVHGAPESGAAIAMRYTATDRPNRQWETLRPMLFASTVAELHETQRGWEEPVNALVSADAEGNIGFLYRGRIPMRSTTKAQQFPVAGWTGEHTWTGDVPFEELPQVINPPEGFVGTANQRPAEATEPYLAYEFTTPGRSTRIAEVLSSKPSFTPDEITALQADTTSIRARGWAVFLRDRGPFAGDAERARALLAGWDGDLAAASAEALLYACFRIRGMEQVFRPILGDRAWDWALNGGNDQGPATLLRWWYYLGEALKTPAGAAATPDGRPWDEVLPAILQAAWVRATELGAADPAAWRWDSVHRTDAQHTLSGAFPALADSLDPAPVAVGGDHDTLQVSSWRAVPGTNFRLSNLSVYRQVVDFAAPEEASWVIPGGASAIPGTAHAADQQELWRLNQRVPMHLDPEAARRAARTTLELRPR